MKTLHLLRHAKSAWDQPGLADRQRGLNKRGKRDAPRMGAALAAMIPPQSVAVSPAKRAQLTLDGLCAGWPALADLLDGLEKAAPAELAEEAIARIEAAGDGPVTSARRVRLA